MNKEKHDFFLHSNEVNHISKEDYDKIELLVNATKAFARSTYQCVYIIDYFHQDFIYASDNLAYLCGLEPEQLMEAGYQMYIDHVPDADLQMLLEVNKKGFDFFNEQPRLSLRIGTRAIDGGRLSDVYRPRAGCRPADAARSEQEGF